MCCSVRTANLQMYSSIVLVFTQNDEALLCQWMKWVGDSDFAHQNSGIMNCLPILAESEQLVCIHYWGQPNSTDLIRNSMCARSWGGLPITRSTASLSCCPGTSPLFRTASDNLKCPFEIIVDTSISLSTPYRASGVIFS